MARFADTASRERVEAIGVVTRAVDLAEGDLSGLPQDFTYLVHLAASQGTDLDYDRAIASTPKAPAGSSPTAGPARAALVMSSAAVYQPHEDPLHAFVETDPIGNVRIQYAPSYSVSKIAGEAVARTCARLFDLPVTVARMNAAYGPNGGLPAYDLDAVLAGKPVTVGHDPYPFTPIHQTDINGQVEALLGAASVPATIVNWGGDEAVSVQEWCALFGELTGRAAEIEVVGGRAPRSATRWTPRSGGHRPDPAWSAGGRACRRWWPSAIPGPRLPERPGQDPAAEGGPTRFPRARRGNGRAAAACQAHHRAR